MFVGEMSANGNSHIVYGRKPGGEGVAKSGGVGSKK